MRLILKNAKDSVFFDVFYELPVNIIFQKDIFSTWMIQVSSIIKI